MLVDSHCHLGSSAFADDRRAVLERAWAAGLGRVVIVGESDAALEQALALAEPDPRIGVVTGVHPHDAAGWTEARAGALREWWRRPDIAAAGEMGLDYHYDHSPRDTQRDVFRRQLALAAEAGLPAVIHAREADQDVAAILREVRPATVILHSFSSGPELLDAGLELGCYFSFSGMITFKNWAGDEAIRQVPAERLLVETDAPYLAPVPYRGKRNEPAWVRAVAEQLARVRGVPADELIRLTGANATRAFRWRPTPQ